MMRSGSGVEYPALYAKGDDEKALKFNCAQRGHQNCLETFPHYLVFSLIAGLRHPILASLMGLLWIISRYQFFEGYSTGDPEKRYQGSLGGWFWTALTALMVLSISSCLGILNIM